MSKKSKTLLLIHGNAVNAKIWDLVSNKFPSNYTIHKPDLRGYGQADKNKFVNAENGVFDWVNDLNEYAEAQNLENVEVWGHSLGGNVLWGILAEMPEWISKCVFISTGSPYGFGGTKNKDGVLCFSDSSGSGAGMVHPEFVKNLKNKRLGGFETATDVLAIFKRLFYKVPEASILKTIAELSFETHLGEKAYPGDFEKSENWPYVKPGKYGALNALSSIYQKRLLQKLNENPQKKVQLVWVHGKQDALVSNESYADVGYLGKIGIIPNWPGSEMYPAQPMIDQIRNLFELKQNQGFKVQEFVLENCGHFPFLESEEFWEIVE
ncbi:MAG: alpha/beta hydrolase [Bacteroidetes bacterium]|nr:alpha/beta hydrolase [Bacteroidota bacterium]NCQ11559.1 alpha/beta hydrolase [Bacteroidota bacterium]